MQIQRIQTLYILIAAILMAVFAFVPMGYFSVADQSAETVASISALDEWGVIIPVGLSVVMLVIDMFLYSNLSLQRTVLKFCMMFTILTVAVVCFTIFKGLEGYEPRLSWWCVAVVIALVFEMLALKGINHDDRLLRSADRLR